MNENRDHRDDGFSEEMTEFSNRSGNSADTEETAEMRDVRRLRWNSERGFLIVAIEVRRIARRLGESGMMGRYFVYDLLSPFYEMLVALLCLRRDDRVWR